MSPPTRLNPVSNPWVSRKVSSHDGRQCFQYGCCSETPNKCYNVDVGVTSSTWQNRITTDSMWGVSNSAPNQMLPKYSQIIGFRIPVRCSCDFMFNRSEQTLESNSPLHLSPIYFRGADGRPHAARFSKLDTFSETKSRSQLCWPKKKCNETITLFYPNWHL